MSKKRVVVAVDSTAYIPKNLIEKYDIRVIPQLCNWSGETLLDDIDITPDEFYRRLETAKEIPTTSQPSAGEFYEFFSQLAEEAESILGIFISDELSGTCASAHAALEMMGDYPIEIVDSRSASMGLGFLVLEAARAIEKGMSRTEAAEHVRSLIPKMKTLFVVDTLEFLHRGGRIGGAQRLIGSMLSIKPLLHLDDGKIEPFMKIRTKRKALDTALDTAMEDMAGKQKVHASVIHAAAHEEARQFFEQVKERLQPIEMLEAELSPVVGTHTGPGLVGLAYYSED